MGYKESKEILAENILAFIRPMRDRRNALASDRGHILRILKNGGEIARERGLAKMRTVRERIGLVIA